MRKCFIAPVCIILTVLVLTTGLDAQVLYGTLVGNVTDASSASIPGAQVKVTNMGTAQAWDLVTGPEGTYSVSTIPPGAYNVTISAKGFRTFTTRDVRVVANSTVRVNASLELGQVTESVEISAEAFALQTDTMDVRSEIGSSELQSVPVPVTRNY